MLDLATRTALGPVEVGGETGNIVYDATSGKVFVNEQTHGELVVIDPVRGTVADRIKVEGCDSNHGLYVEGTQQLAFIACEDNSKLLVLDLRTRQVTARFDTGGTPDVLDFDQGLHRLYVASESGVVSVFDEKDHKLALVASAKLADHAHTVAVDQATHRVYFPLQDLDAHPVLRVMEPTP